MKNTKYFRILIGALLVGATFTACDKFEDDVPPARMASLALHDDIYNTNKNQRVQLNVLANDTIGGAAAVQFAVPQHGVIQTDSTGMVYYHPAANFVGTENFTYKACLNNDCAIANVTINVKNDTTAVCSVKAYDDIRTLNQGTYDSLRVMLNDNLCGETMANTTLSLVQGPAHGQAFIANPFKQLVYSPTQNYVGPDEITYQISNSKGTSTAKVKFNVLPYCVIRANADSLGINRHLGAIDTASVAVLANDIICPNNGPVNVQVLTPNTQFGNVTMAYNGPQARIIYMTKPNTPKNVSDIVQYRICQGNNCHSNSIYVIIR